MTNFEKLIKSIEVNIRFNDKYCLQYYEPSAYNRISELISLMRKNKELSIEEHYTISKVQKHFYLNYFKIKNLNEAQPRIIAQKFIGKKKIRIFIFNRDKHQCLKCNKKTKLQIDHINPISKGGENKLSNLQTLCNSCNSIKRDNFKDYRNGSR